MLLAAVAATAVLSSRSGPPSSGVRADSHDGSDDSALDAAAPLAAPVDRDGAAASSSAAPEPPAAGRPAVKVRFKVAVAPLILATAERKATLEFQSIYAALLEELRAIPNLELVELSSELSVAPDDVDFDLRVKGEARPGFRPSALLRVYWSAKRGGAGDWSTPTDSSVPGTPETIARAAAEQLRRFPFPPEIARPVELEAIVLDTNRPSEERLGALAELKTIPQRFAFVGRDERRVVAVAAADIVANSTDPDIRSRVWKAMRKVDDPYLIGPLVDSVLSDDSEQVRVDAVQTLGNNFGHDPKAVAGLEYAFVHDLSPQVRANAHWETLDENSRRGYLAGTLLREDLSDAARLELLTAGVSGFRGYVDRQAVQALVDIASRARSSTEQLVADEGPGRVSAAELVPLLVELLTDNGSEEIRSAAASALLRHRDEVGVRDTLELAQCDDPSQRVRNQIAYALRRFTVDCRQRGVVAAPAGGRRPPATP